MSSILNGSSALQHFVRGNVVEICNGIMFDFYLGLPVSFSPIITVWNTSTRLVNKWSTWIKSRKSPVHFSCTYINSHPMYDNEQGMRTTISKVYGENCHSLFRPCMSACRVSSRPRYFQRLMRARKQTALMNGPILKTEKFVNAEQTRRVVIRTQRDWRRVNDVLTQGDSASPICITKAANCSTTAILTRHSNLWWQTTQISLVYSLVFT